MPRRRAGMSGGACRAPPGALWLGQHSTDKSVFRLPRRGRPSRLGVERGAPAGYRPDQEMPHRLPPQA
eukprot:5089096-Pyramimonas_sp.AAC.1